MMKQRMEEESIPPIPITTTTTTTTYPNSNTPLCCTTQSIDFLDQIKNETLRQISRDLIDSQPTQSDLPVDTNKSKMKATATAASTTTTTAATVSSTASVGAATRVDQFEIAVRSLVLQLVQTVTMDESETNNNDKSITNDTNTDTDSSTMKHLIQLWTEIVQIVHHVVYFIDWNRSMDTLIPPPPQQQQQQHPDHLKIQKAIQYQSLLPVASQLRKILIMVLEDILDTVSNQNGYIFWKSCIMSNSLLFTPLLWNPTTTTTTTNNHQHTKQASSSSSPPPCWLPFLKCANKFIRRLQTNGGISMLVVSEQNYTDNGNSTRDNHNQISTSTSSLSEASQLVKATTTTTTTTTNTPTTAIAIAAATAAANVLSLLSTVYPMSEKSATRIWGSHNSDNPIQLEPYESDMESSSVLDASTIHPEHIQTTSTTATATPDSNFYETFWKLQHDFRNPNAIDVASFLQRVRKVVQTFQNHPTVHDPSEVDTTTTTTPSTFTSDTTRTRLELLLHPYLTQRRLLSIQITDPMIRTVMLYQFYIVAHHIVSQVPSLQTQLQIYLDAVQTMIPPSDMKLFQSSAILDLSEPQWRTWKQNKCQPDLERIITPNVSKSSSNNSSSSSSSRKRKTLDRTNDTQETEIKKIAMTTTPTSTSTTAGMDIDEASNAYQWTGHDLVSISQRMRASIPTYHNHLEEYVEALDPASGIEADYHPGNNAVYAWQALRLLSEQHLQEFQYLHPSGNMEGMVRIIYQKYQQITIPGDGPEPYKEEDDNDMEERNDVVVAADEEMQQPMEDDIDMTEVVKSKEDDENIIISHVSEADNEVITVQSDTVEGREINETTAVVKEDTIVVKEVDDETNSNDQVTNEDSNKMVDKQKEEDPKIKEEVEQIKDDSSNVKSEELKKMDSIDGNQKEDKTLTKQQLEKKNPNVDMPKPKAQPSKVADKGITSQGGSSGSSIQRAEVGRESLRGTDRTLLQMSRPLNERRDRRVDNRGHLAPNDDRGRHDIHHRGPDGRGHVPPDNRGRSSHNDRWPILSDDRRPPMDDRQRLPPPDASRSRSDGRNRVVDDRIVQDRRMLNGGGGSQLRVPPPPPPPPPRDESHPNDRRRGSGRRL